MPSRRLTDDEVASTVGEVVANALQREATYLPRALPLSRAQKSSMQAFFPGTILNHVRILELIGERVPNPAYQERAAKRGYRMMLDFTHMAAIAHPRLIIFQEKLTPRLLFHGLVHVVQYAELGVERYLDYYVRAFVFTESYTGVPLETQAFQLDQRYTEDPERPFSVQAEVRQWIEAGKFVLRSNQANQQLSRMTDDRLHK